MKKNEAIEVTIEAPCGIGPQTGKSEEIEILSRIIGRFGGTQTYLASLFSAALMEYFANTVKDDFCPDIMADYKNEMENRRKFEFEAQSLRTQVEYRDADLDSLKEKVKAEITGKDRMIDGLTEQVAMLNRRYSEQVGETNKASAERDALSEQVRDLKVKLFDMMTK